MNAKPKLARPHVLIRAVAAALSAAIAVGLLGAVAGVFQRQGEPFEQVVTAERACSDYAFASERQACVRIYIAAARMRIIARH